LYSLFNKIRDIFRETLGSCECYQMKIPERLDYVTYQKQLILLLKKENNYK